MGLAVSRWADNRIQRCWLETWGRPRIIIKKSLRGLASCEQFSAKSPLQPQALVLLETLSLSRSLGRDEAPGHVPSIDRRLFVSFFKSNTHIDK
jgi:hypothetical protein